MTLIAGIDGCHSGWLYISRDLETDNCVPRILSCISEVLLFHPRPEVLTIDIPIGLTDSGPRRCDLEARKHLGKPRSNSVFPAPIRPTLEAMTYLDACRIRERVEHRKMSKQAWGILPKIREVDIFLRTTPTCRNWIREVHPEVSFWAWNSRKAMLHKKRSPLGREERAHLVLPYFGQAYADARAILPRGRYAIDDLLDAFAALWTAERIKAGTAISIPPNPPVDGFGLRMEIIA